MKIVLPLLVLVIIAIAITFALSRKAKTGKAAKDRNKADINKFLTSEQIKTFFERPASFSLVLFRGDVPKDIQDLLESCKYKVLESTTVRSNFPDIYIKLPAPSGAKNSIVSKGYCNITGYTVLCEPEMVFSTIYTDAFGAERRSGSNRFEIAGVKKLDANRKS